MSCYLRHVKDEKACLMCLLDEAGIDATTPTNRRQIDRAIKNMLGTDDCSKTWQIIKKTILPDDDKRREFVGKLKEAVF